MKHNFKLFRFLVNLLLISATPACSPKVFSQPLGSPNDDHQQLISNNNFNNQNSTGSNQDIQKIIIGALKSLSKNLKFANNKLNIIDHYTQNLDLKQHESILEELKGAYASATTIKDTLGKLLACDQDLETQFNKILNLMIQNYN